MHTDLLMTLPVKLDFRMKIPNVLSIAQLNESPSLSIVLKEWREVSRMVFSCRSLLKGSPLIVGAYTCMLNNVRTGKKRHHGL